MPAFPDGAEILCKMPYSDEEDDVAEKKAHNTCKLGIGRCNKKVWNSELKSEETK